MTTEHPSAGRLRDRVRTEVVSEIIELLTGREHGIVDPFAAYRQPSDPDDILPEILAARCLGIRHGDPGPELPETFCRYCWGARYVWLGNTWGLHHVEQGRASLVGPGVVATVTVPAGHGLFGCDHACHRGEVWAAATSDSATVHGTMQQLRNRQGVTW